MLYGLGYLLRIWVLGPLYGEVLGPEAEQAKGSLNGSDLCGSSIVVDAWEKGPEDVAVAVWVGRIPDLKGSKNQFLNVCLYVSYVCLFVPLVSVLLCRRVIQLALKSMHISGPCISCMCPGPIQIPPSGLGFIRLRPVSWCSRVVWEFGICWEFRKMRGVLFWILI